MGIGVVPAVGVHHGDAVGQGLLALMVVRDAEVDAEAAAEPGLLQRRDAAVHGEDERRALFAQGADGGLVEAVALLKAAGDVGDAVAAPAAEVVRQERGGGDAVHVVVAEDDDPLAALERPADPLDDLIHIAQEEGVRKGKIGTKKCPRSLRRVVAAAAQYSGRQRGKTSRLQPGGSPFVIGGHLPGSVFHKKTHPKNIFPLLYHFLRHISIISFGFRTGGQKKRPLSA